MGRNSSGTRGGLQPGDATYKGSVGKPEPLVNMKDPALYKATKEAISRYHSVLGVRQKNVKLAELSAGTYGVHVTANGKSEGYASGWSTKTNKAVAHTVTHELAHATWNANMTGANQKAAGKEVNKLFKSWKKDNKKSGYGKYAETNVSEFWAETVTKAIHGKSDKYTKKVKEICKKYKL